MRQVLDLLTSLIASHPNTSVVKSMVSKIVRRLLSIITHEASQPLVKPAFKTLEHFIGKGSISVGDLSLCRRGQTAPETNGTISSDELPYSDLDDIVLETFEWMNFQDVSPSAGKFLVSLFKVSKEAFPGMESGLGTHTRLWQRWISDGLSKYPDALENVKNYLLPPLFKLDRTGSLAFLEELNSQGTLSTENNRVESDFLVQLSAMEVGKKAGLVEESSEFFATDLSIDPGLVNQSRYHNTPKKSEEKWQMHSPRRIQCWSAFDPSLRYRTVSCIFRSGIFFINNPSIQSNSIRLSAPKYRASICRYGCEI